MNSTEFMKRVVDRFHDYVEKYNKPKAETKGEAKDVITEDPTIVVEQPAEIKPKAETKGEAKDVITEDPTIVVEQPAEIKPKAKSKSKADHAEEIVEEIVTQVNDAELTSEA